MNQDRIERYSKVRVWLSTPYAQKPSPHQILNQMLTTEQTMNLRLTNSRQPWNLINTNITTVAGQNTYPISQPVSAFQQSGKVYFVVRSTGNENAPYLPVPFDDFSELDYGKLPEGTINPLLIVPEKISFYRSNLQDQTVNAVIQPTPSEVLTYSVWFLSGSLDRSQALMGSTGAVSELADYEDIKSSLALLPYCEWRDDDAFNENRRRTLAAGLAAQLSELEPIVDTYIKNINHPKTFDTEYWND